MTQSRCLAVQVRRKLLAGERARLAARRAELRERSQQSLQDLQRYISSSLDREDQARALQGDRRALTLKANNYNIPNTSYYINPLIIM